MGADGLKRSPDFHPNRSRGRTVRGAIVLAGGPSRRLGRPKAFVEIGGVPLVVHVVHAALEVADEIVIVSRGDLAARIERTLPSMSVARDQRRLQSPLVGLVAGASALRSEYVVALACDVPFVRPTLLRRLFSAARRREAAIPRWSDGRIEPLVAVYARRPLLQAARAALHAGERSNQSMIDHLDDIRYVDVSHLRPADPRLVSFVNLNTPADIRRARRMVTQLARGPRTR